jgi:hypothetical protein
MSGDSIMPRWLALGIFVISGQIAMAETWPLKSPAELKAVHGATFAGMQLLTYRHSIEPAKDAAASQTIIGIGRDVIFREEDGNRFVVDLRLGRIYEVGPNTRYVNYPVAASIVSRDAEMGNRINLSRALAAAKVERDKIGYVLEPFWDATELKVTAPNEPPPVVAIHDDQGETVFSYKGQDVLRWRPVAEQLPPQVAGNLGRALLWLWPGHPFLDAKVAAEAKAPQHFRVRTAHGNELRTDDYQLIDSRWCETCDALPADAQPGLWVGGIFEAELAPVMIAASQGKFNATSSENYVRKISEALDRWAPLDAFLYFAERTLQYGNRECQPDETSDYCRVLNRLIAQARASSELQTLQRNMTTRSLDAANAIAAMRDKVGPNAYYVDLASIDCIPESALRFKTGEQEPLKSAERRMASTLAAMPVVPAVYRDIGNIYFAAVDTKRAWLAWEMGMANPGLSSEPDLWRNPRNIESLARRRHPEFF